ncbi:unnamed protein product, partial [Phaeothamnion confervicola]
MEALLEAGFSQAEAESAMQSTSSVELAAELILARRAAAQRPGDGTLRLSVPSAAATTSAAAPLPSPSAAAPPATPSKHSEEVAARQVLLEKAEAARRRTEAVFRAEAKARKTRELAIFREQHEESKAKKSLKAAAAACTSTGDATPTGWSTAPKPPSTPASTPTAAPPLTAAAAAATAAAAAPRVQLHVRLPMGSSLSCAMSPDDTLASVLEALDVASVLGSSRELELRCPVPLPGRVYCREELAAVTLAAAGLVPRGTLIVQFV